MLLVLQGLDASGKDGVIRSVFTGVNPMGVHVVSFRAPTETERAHDYLWRVHAELPPRGDIGVFNRSHYEDVVAVRMHALAPEEVWRRRPGHIREWERMLVDEGTTIVKVFLNVSKEEQRKRFQERIDDPEKRWKFRTADLDVRERYDEYVDGVGRGDLHETSTEWAPWHVVPADRNWVKSTAVATLLVDTLERLDPQLPDPEPGIEGLVIRVTNGEPLHASRHDRGDGAARAAARVRGVRQDRRVLDAPAHVPRLRQGRLLRQLAEPARVGALRGGRTSADPLGGAARGLALVFRRPGPDLRPPRSVELGYPGAERRCPRRADRRVCARTRAVAPRPGR